MAETDLDVATATVEFGAWEGYASQLTEELDVSGPSFHEALHSPSPYHWYQSSHEFSASPLLCPCETDKKVTVVSSNCCVVRACLRSADAGGSGRVGGEYTWDGKGGGSWSGYAEGEVHDNNGNYIEGRAEANSDGSGSVGVYGGSRR